MKIRKLAMTLLLSGLAAAQQLPDAPQPKPDTPKQTQTQPQHRPWIVRHKKAEAIGGGIAVAAVAAYLLAGHHRAAHFRCPAGGCVIHPPTF